MKKYLFLLVTLIMMGVGTANAQKVYVTDNGTVYHKEKGCTTLKQAKKVNTVSIEDAKKKKGIRPCKVCYADICEEEVRSDFVLTHCINIPLLWMHNSGIFLMWHRQDILDLIGNTHTR